MTIRHALPACVLALLLTTACGGDSAESDAPAEGATTAVVSGLPGEGGPLGAVPVPADNPMTDAKVALGHQLFFDSRMSVDGSRSCYSCHTNEDGNGGGDPTAIGAADRALTRHSPVIWNVAYMPAFYWDGRSGALEAQVRGAWGGGNMGVGADNLDAKAAEIGAIPGYAEQFAAIFPDRGATGVTVSEAIASYERTLVCDATRYDRHMAGDGSAITEEEARGLELFNGKGTCAMCHTPPFFSAQFGTDSGVYYNVGIGHEGRSEDEVDVGRYSVTEADADWGAFKVPSLRNVAESSPYFHDGSVVSLEDAVRYMAGGGVPNRNLTPLMMDRNLSDEEITAIVAFMGTLTCGDLTQPTLPN